MSLEPKKVVETGALGRKSYEESCETNFRNFCGVTN